VNAFKNRSLTRYSPERYTDRFLFDWFSIETENAGKTGGGADLEAVATEARHGRLCVDCVVGVGVHLGGRRAEVVVRILILGIRVRVSRGSRNRLQ
jgi:hypothetical protein